MNQFKPHPRSGFEGYYSKFDLPSGGRVALIICTIPGAKERPHKVSFTYVSKAPEHEYFQRQIWPDEMTMTSLDGDRAFRLEAPGVGHMEVAKDSITSYEIKHEDFHFSGKTTDHSPWSPSSDSPEGLLSLLPLPLHWYVHTLGANCDFTLEIPSFPRLAPQDRSGRAVVHQEKNWANSFPSAHIWIQARIGVPPNQADSPGTSTAEKTTGSSSSGSAPDAAPYKAICIAGGRILGTEAYLLGYRSSTHPSCSSSSSSSSSSPSSSPLYALDFRPPITMRLLSLSPTLVRAVPDFPARTFTLSARSWFTRLDVEARADPASFFPLAAPFAEGHRENFLAQSFGAGVLVRVYAWRWGRRWWDVRGWWTGSQGGDGEGQGEEGVGRWVLEEETRFEDGSLEFGGGYYPWAGTERLAR